MKDVGRHTYLARRKGTANWQFRARVPLDLVADFGKREVTRSLGTSDLAEAKRRVRDEADAFDKQCRALRDRAASDGGVTIGSVPLTSLSETAIEQMAIGWFSTVAAEGEQRARLAVPLDRDEALINLGQDEAALNDPDDLGLDASYQTAIRLLRAADVRLLRRQLNPIRAAGSPMLFVVSREDAASAQFRQLLALLRRARLEDVHRSRAQLPGNYQDVAFDPVFRPRVEPNSKTLAQVIAAFQAEPERAGQITKLQQTYASVFRLASEMFGADRPIREIDRDECKAFRATVQALPPNATKRFPGKALVDVAKLAKPENDRLRPSTINHYLDALAMLFNYAQSEGWITQNPAKRLAIKGVKKRGRRDPFTAAELTKIFQAPLYAGCVDDEGGYAKPGPNHPRRGRFWIPLISLFTGMRQGEVAQLRTDDVRLFQGVLCIFIAADGDDVDEADRKRVKTEAGERFVPVHPMLEQIGFARHVERMGKAGAERLFPDIVRGADGYFSPFSKWFGRFLAEAGVKRDRNAFHSFRHTFRDAMREADVPLDSVIALGGWEDGSTQANYGGRQIAAPTLHRHIKRIRYDGLDLMHLIDVDEKASEVQR
ncbi:tyrosine-type recombinase/integrase [Methylobacterium sp. WL30]|uniref:site-specific integrase n=1 Tax=unclassified Methylobacterium TaxID=2615210 RepID=UPI0011C8FE38|nr:MULTISPECIES: site-specific integrase [unclassified Methylobacterium]TXN34484.1 tyrosine-type recombinase/integrase [Methylobacterium sp. WL93]TXN49324.1 tyrosine-type recombinase/integrase [Methylobacterium sp. WL119]TXN62186.1 tyrosine-type recombinase/integrase [Methylobacterium sp. WL30]